MMFRKIVKYKYNDILYFQQLYVYLNLLFLKCILKYLNTCGTTIFFRLTYLYVMISDNTKIEISYLRYIGMKRFYFTIFCLILFLVPRGSDTHIHTHTHTHTHTHVTILLLYRTSSFPC